MTDPITTPAQMREAAALAVANIEIGYHDGIGGDWHPYNGLHIISAACAAIRALPVADPLCTWPSCGHTAKGQCNPTFALRAIVAERQAMHLETCPSCSGSGMALDDGGDPGLCHECKGDGLDVRETPVCERQQDLVTADDPRIADYERAYQYALHLADTLRERHYPANTCWRPFGDLPGLLTQIDNMIAGFGPAQAIRDKAMDDAAAKATTAALLEDLGNNLWNICNSINDEDWIGKPKGLTAKVVGHFEKHHRMHVEMLERAARQVAAIRAMKGKPE